jgi:hypothetical protein
MSAAAALIRAEAKYLGRLAAGDKLIRLTWKQWLELRAPYPETGYTTKELTVRFRRNGYAWDAHGTVYIPKKEARGKTGFFLVHGGAGSEREFIETPDGRPGLAPILASQGFRTITVTFVGEYPPGGLWKEPVKTRQLHYLLDRKLGRKEILDRDVKRTLNVIIEGAARLTDRAMPGYDVMSYGHSAGGPVAMGLQRFLKKARVKGIVGWGSGAPKAWQREWQNWWGEMHGSVRALDHITRRTPDYFHGKGYEDPPDLTPWGGAAEYHAWATRNKSQVRMGLLDNQHSCDTEVLKAYVARTGLPLTEFNDHLRDPNPDWLAQTAVLRLVGDRDLNHWNDGNKVKDKLETFLVEKFAQRCPRASLVIVPRYGHFGYASLYNERIAYAWLWALREGYFDEAGIRSGS